MQTPLRTPSDNELRELLFLQAAVKDMQSRITLILDLCKVRGSFCTENYVVVVYPQKQRRLAGLDVVMEALGKDILEKYELIKYYEFRIVKVAEK